MAAAPILHLLFNIYVICVIVTSVLAQQYSPKHSATVGSTLDTCNTSKWISPSGEFAFGFHNINPTKLYLIGVWFDNISTQTLVWTADRDEGPVGEDSTLKLTSTGLQLSNSRSTARQIIDLPGQNVSEAEIRDDGNFVLLDASNQPVWQSFDNPTDTLVPGQAMKSPYTLYSRATNNYYSTGRFALSFQENGDLKLFPAERVLDSYWSTQTGREGSNPSSLNFDTNGLLSLVDASTNKTVWVASIWNDIGRAEQFRSRVTLDTDGILRGYVWKGDRDTSWIAQWQALNDPCQVYGQCGLNGICQMIQDSIACTCPLGFDFAESDDPFEGCSRDPSQHVCSATCVMQGIGNTDWSGNDYAEMKSLDKIACQQACIEDCMCVVVVYGMLDGQELCLKKAMPLRDGRTCADRSTFVKVCI